MSSYHSAYHMFKRVGSLALIVAALIVVNACQGVPSPQTTSENPLDYEPVPVPGEIQTQTSSLPTWQQADGVVVDILGKGLGSRFSATSYLAGSFPEPLSPVEALYVQVVFKAGTLSNPINEFIAPSEIVLSTHHEMKRLSAGELTLSLPSDDSGTTLHNTGRIYEAMFAPANNIEVNISGIRKFGTLYTPRALIVYVIRQQDHTPSYSSGAVVNRYLHGHSGYETASYDVPIATSQQARDLTVRFVISELGQDSRNVELIASAGGVSRTEVISFPNEDDELLIYDLQLPGVPAGTDTVMTQVKSAAVLPGESVWDNGDSVFWHAVSVDDDRYVYCDYTFFRSQAEVDAFDPTCTHVVGSLIIGGNTYHGSEPLPDINDLEPLSNLLAVEGDLAIGNNPQLTSLHGLHNIGKLGGSLTVFHNNALTNLEGLNNLHRISTDHRRQGRQAILIRMNGSLRDLQGLGVQGDVVGSVEIVENGSLETLHGLEGINVVGNLFVGFNPSLRSLEGLNNLECGHVTFTQNDALLGITALSSFRPSSATCSGSTLDVSDNAVLDCSLEPKPPFLSLSTKIYSSGNAVDCAPQ